MPKIVSNCEQRSPVISGAIAKLWRNYGIGREAASPRPYFNLVPRSDPLGRGIVNTLELLVGGRPLHVDSDRAPQQRERQRSDCSDGQGCENLDLERLALDHPADGGPAGGPVMSSTERTTPICSADADQDCRLRRSAKVVSGLRSVVDDRRRRVGRAAAVAHEQLQKRQPWSCHSHSQD